LFADLPPAAPWAERLGPGSVLLHGFALGEAPAIYGEIQQLTTSAPFRRMHTPGGRPLSVLMSNCGELGWISDQNGYRYVASDPQSEQPWPAMPARFLALAQSAAAAAGFADFQPNACLINCYLPGARMSLHQDRDERDLNAPIVSVSLGLPATFLFGGLQRSAPASRHLLTHGDVLVWGGPDRLRFHGVQAIQPGQHACCGDQRINLTFRQAR
jgi:alkylated DNA repair protein (DNA oxidative demethylase)